jgi:hypothetical protein
MKTLSRRAFLQGTGGATLALPWLESVAVAAPVVGPTQRLAIFYAPIGVERSGFFPGEGKVDVPKFNSDPKVKVEGKFTPHLLKVDHFHLQQFAYLVEKMDSIVEADGTTLLDNTLLTFGSGLGDGATHQYNDLPIVFAGGKTLGFKSGRHLHCADGTPLANLWLTQARSLGVEGQRFADSTGTLDLLSS